MARAFKPLNLRAISLTLAGAILVCMIVSALNFYVTQYDPIGRGALEEVSRFIFVYIIFRTSNLIFLPSIMISLSEIFIPLFFGYVMFGSNSGNEDIYYLIKYSIYYLTYASFGIFSGIVYLKRNLENRNLASGLAILIPLKVSLYFTWVRIENRSTSEQYVLIFMAIVLIFFISLSYFLYRRSIALQSLDALGFGSRSS